MKVAVFGLGFVGCATAAGLVRSGHEVFGIDFDERRVRMINRGDPTVHDENLDRMIRAFVRQGSLKATIDAEAAICESEVSLISLKTPRKKNGTFDYGQLLQAAWEIGEGIKKKNGTHVVGLRSAVFPGTTESLVVPELEKISGKKAGQDFSVCVHPEFVRVGAAQDFDQPPLIVVGCDDQQGRDAFAQLYQGIGPVSYTEVRTAELLRYVCKAFHALKLAFVGEVQDISKMFEVDAHELLDVFCRDAKLNISPVYLKPGLVYRDPSLVQTLRLLLDQPKVLDAYLPLLNAVLKSSELRRSV